MKQETSFDTINDEINGLMELKVEKLDKIDVQKKSVFKISDFGNFLSHHN